MAIPPKVALPSIYDVTDCEDVEEFWQLISPIGKLFGRSDSSFIFRGQSNSDWELIPQVFRHQCLAKYKRGMMGMLKDHPGQFFFEWALLSGFLKYCDFAGLAIPNDSMEFRRYFSQDNITSLHGRSSHDWPHERVVPLMALAQHHGIPTRLLDWTSNPYVASYFAAISAITSEPTADQRLAVFAIELSAFNRCDGLRHIAVPGSTSVNVSSQGGSFVLVSNSGYRGDAFPTDVSLESKLGVNQGILYKLTLPATLAGNLLLRCDKFGVSAASIFRGYDGAAKAVLEATLAFNFSLAG